MSANSLMQGFPPTSNAQVTLANWRKPPFNKWSFRHARELMPTAEIPIDMAGAWELPVVPIHLDELRVDASGQKIPLSAALQATDTDAIVILHRGQIIFDYYAPDMDREAPHILMSVSKSILGLLIGILVDRGQLRADELIAAILPETKGTAYEGACVRDLLDMRAGVLFDENYLSTSGPYIAYRKASGWDPHDPGEAPTDLRSFFKTLMPDGNHNGAFHYLSLNTDLLGWLIERKTGRRYVDLVSELLWKPLGARINAYMTVDRLGAPRTAGGICVTAEDLAKLGLLIAQKGRRASHQIIPEWWIDDIVGAGSRDAWEKGDFAHYLPGMPMHYRSKWYVLNGKTPLLFGLGVFGQYLFVDPKNEIVIAKFSSQALPMDKERILLTMSMVNEIRKHLVQ